MALRLVSKFSKPSSPSNLFPFLRNSVRSDRNVFNKTKFNRMQVQFPIQQKCLTTCCKEPSVNQTCQPDRLPQQQQRKIIIEIGANGIKMFEGYLMEFPNDLLKAQQLEAFKKIAEENAAKFKIAKKDIADNQMVNVGPPQPQIPKWLNIDSKNGQKSIKKVCGDSNQKSISADLKPCEGTIPSSEKKSNKSGGKKYKFGCQQFEKKSGPAGELSNSRSKQQKTNPQIGGQLKANFCQPKNENQNFGNVEFRSPKSPSTKSPCGPCKSKSGPSVSKPTAPEKQMKKSETPTKCKAPGQMMPKNNSSFKIAGPDKSGKCYKTLHSPPFNPRTPPPLRPNRPVFAKVPASCKPKVNKCFQLKPICAQLPKIITKETVKPRSGCESINKCSTKLLNR